MLMKILTDPRLERLRVTVPYPIFVAALILPVSAICSAVMIASDWQHVRANPLQAAAIAAVPFAIALIFPGLLALVIGLGYLSGYRPLRHTWPALSDADARKLGEHLQAAAALQGFRVVWQRDGGAFVAVRNVDLEFQQPLHSGTHFPMRLSYLLKPAGGGASEVTARLKLSNRTAVVWDTGETHECHAVGSTILDDAAALAAGRKLDAGDVVIELDDDDTGAMPTKNAAAADPFRATDDVGRIERAPRAIVYLTVDWSVVEHRSREAVLAALAALPPELGFEFYTVREDGPTTAPWLAARGWPAYTSGNGPLLWFEHGQVVGKELLPGHVGAEAIVARTRSIWPDRLPAADTRAPSTEPA